MLDGKAVSKTYFSSQLKHLLSLLQVIEKITSHSFCYGACNHWINLGFTDLQIMKKGRWRSNAVLKYIRGMVDHTPT